ncbi:MAG: UDP-4-amino-4,6-dideoxy-N-acetyl-beta-L-altrosamine transaminase [Candidatus Brocadiaceae bacterium]|nr:UDP-4-amino-4,6-dideoxy-N-acetyl-beta-L-altrosamine transaminase [Candidatus Brocadiaceae bacterium]
MKIKQDQLEDSDKSTLLPYGRQWIDEDDIQAVVNVLRSERITQGPKIEEFEKTLAEYCGAKYAVAVSSGTAALHIACLAAGLGGNDTLWTSPNTFVASANCALYCGAKVDFVDIDRLTYNMSISALETKLSKASKDNCLPKIIIPVHFAGQSCEIEQIYYSSKRYNFTIIEDACHALGSIYKNKKVGSCEFSDMAVMSFHPVKHITTGEGGAVLTNDEVIYKKLKRLRSHGITHDPNEFLHVDLTSHNSVINPWYYEQIDLGFHYRITDIQCALGISQLKKIDIFCKRRREIVDYYNSAFRNTEFINIPFESEDCNSNLHLYVLLFDFDKIGVNRAQFMLELRSKGIQTQVHYIPVHLQPFYAKHFGTKCGDFPNAEQYYKKCLSIPLYPAMTNKDAERVANEIISLVSKEMKQ